MSILKSQWGLSYLTVGVLVCLVLAATHSWDDSAVAAVLAAVALALYIAIFEFYTIMQNATRTLVIALAGVGGMVCFTLFSRLTDALISGRLNLAFRSATDWAIPVSVAIITVFFILRRKRSTE